MRLLKARLPAWILLIIFAVATALFVYFREPIYNYRLSGLSAEGRGLDLDYGAAPVFADRDFFRKSQESLINQKASFILADLATMQIAVYQEGKVVKEAKILAKGREGSWWETPAGLYKIETKERNHFSSFGHVNQPWSMAFQGNFFIHGWPEYPDGTPVSSQYSGGCIRLSNEDAEAIYSLSSVGMPVLVYRSDRLADGHAFSTKKPELTAQSYLAADIGSNYVFLSQGAEEVRPIASLTKLVTAMVAAEMINLDAPVTVTESMIVPTSKPRLQVGQSITAYQLLFPLLLESSNEAAEALARVAGRERFIGLMNTKAKAIGMTSTRFVDPSGAGEGNVSTPQDLFMLAKYLAHNRSFILHFSTGELRSSAYGTSIFTDLGNFNDFVGDPRFAGGKVGQTTAAGETGLYLFNLNIGGETREVVTIVLGSTNRKVDAATLAEYVSNNFQ